MTMTGADAGQLRLLAGRFEQTADALEQTQAALRSHLHASPWNGSDADRFRGDWDTSHRSALAGAALCLRDAAGTLRRNADEQTAASAADSASISHAAAGSPSGSAPASEKRSTRLDTPEAQQQLLSRESIYLRNAGSRSQFPDAFARADEWLHELQSGTPSPEELASFEKYMILVKVANMQRSAVHDAATMAIDQYTQMAESAGGALSGGFGLHGDGDIVDGLISGAQGIATDAAKSAAIDPLIGAMTEYDAEALSQRYTAQADALLSQYAASHHGPSSIGFAPPGNIITPAIEAFNSRVDVIRSTADMAEAFTPLTGDGSVLDSGLRTIVSLAPGGTAIDVMGIIGDSAQAYYHYQAGTAALDFAMNAGITELSSLAERL